MFYFVERGCFILIVEVKKEQRLNYLFNVITKEEYWTSNHFRVLNIEAGAGQSIKTLEGIAWLGVHKPNCKIVYVQPFANMDSTQNDGIELQKTVGTINKFAHQEAKKAGIKLKKEVAHYISTKNKDQYTKIINTYNIICITHNKYLEICRNNKKSIVDNCDILIIDEFPNLYQEYKISRKEIRLLHGLTLDNKNYNIQDVTEYLINLIDQYNTKDIKIINLQNYRQTNRIKILNKIKQNYKDKQIKEVCDAIIELLSHTSVFYNNAFYTFNSKIQYKLAQKNNIILDANASFDDRYKLNAKLFKLDHQTKIFDYKDSTITFYPIKTTKNKMDNYVNIIGDTIDYINKNNYSNNGCLIVSDKDRINKIPAEQQEQLKEQNIEFTYFGNFLGKNNWSKLDTVWIIKTPYYPFYQYVLMYIYYSGSAIHSNTSCKIGNKKGEKYVVFYNNKFDSFKNSIVAGEIYQAAKRIARDGRNCNINIVIDNPEIFSIVSRQFANIKQITRSDLQFKEKKKRTKKQEKLEQYKAILTQYKQKGVDKIYKKDFAEQINCSPRNLSRQIKPLAQFLLDNNIIMGKGKYQEYIIFKDNLA